MGRRKVNILVGCAILFQNLDPLRIIQLWPRPCIVLGFLKSISSELTKADRHGIFCLA